VKTILISGGQGKFAKALININTKYKILAPAKDEMNISSLKSINDYIRRKKIDFFVHSAAFSTPMADHKIKIEKSVSTNIIGTSNVVLACSKKNIKLIYISTNFVYQGTKGNYSEKDMLLPVNEYGWSKLGGECAVKLYENSLILRVCMSDDNFPHSRAFTDYNTCFLKKSDAAKITLKLLSKKGIINVGGKIQSAYNFAKKLNPKIKKTRINSEIKQLIGTDTSMNTNKLKRLI
jgi:dTDP-4-dehydrorhamnose reductase